MIVSYEVGSGTGEGIVAHFEPIYRDLTGKSKENYEADLRGRYFNRT
jgi:hypothetical protein